MWPKNQFKILIKFSKCQYFNRCTKNDLIKIYKKIHNINSDYGDTSKVLIYHNKGQILFKLFISEFLDGYGNFIDSDIDEWAKKNTNYKINI